MWPEVSYVEEGKPEVVDALTAVFFINAHHEKCASTIASAIDEVVSYVGLDAFRYYVDEDGYASDLTAAQYRSLIARLRNSAQDGEGGLSLFGDDRYQTGRSIYYYGRPEPSEASPEERNVLSFHLSRKIWMERGAAPITSLMLRLAATLPFSFGYLSPCLAYEHDIRPAARIARRYPGFDILKALAVAGGIGDQMAGIYWLSFLGQTLAQALGGLAGIRALLPHLADLAPLGADKIMMRIINEPEVGDLNRKDNLPAYRAAATALEPYLHIPQITYFYEDDGITPNKDAMVAWHRRFLE